MPEETSATNSNQLFPTPDPNELQSEESESSVREMLAEEQGTEFDVIESVEDDHFIGKEPDQTAYGLSSPPPAD